MKQLILGLFSDKRYVDDILLRLKVEGVRNRDMSVVGREDHIIPYRSAKKNLAGEGALTGGILGGLAGLLVAATPVLIPGVGFFAVGPAIILSGFAMGAVTGGFLGALVDLGVSTNQAQRYERRIQEGGVLLAVAVDEDLVEDIEEIFEYYHCEEFTCVPYKLKTKMIEVTQIQATNAAS